MGSYGIGSGRLLASVVEEYHDEFGLIMPITVAPYEVYLVELAGSKKESAQVKEIAEDLFKNLVEAGFEVLLMIEMRVLVLSLTMLT